MPRILLAALLVLAVAMSGCKITGSKTDNAQAQFRLFNLAAGAGPINITKANADGTDPTVQISSVAFGTASSYKGFDSGATNLYTVGLTSGSSTLFSTSYNLTANTNYTLIMFGTAGTPGGLLVADTTTSPNNGYFQIRPIHAAVGSALLDFYVTPVGTDINSTAASFNSFNISGVGAFLQFLAGDYQLRVTPANSKIVIYDSGKVTFSAGTIASAVIYTTGSGSLVNLQTMVQDSANTVTPVANLLSQFKVTHASPNSGAFNVLVDGVSKFSNVPYKGTSSYLPITAGTRNLGLQPVASPGSITAASNVNFSGGNDFSVVAVGNAGAVNMLVLQDNNLPPSAGYAKVRFVNASPDAPPLDVQVNFVTYVSGLAQNAASTYVQFLENTLPGYTMTVSITGSATPALVIPGVLLTAGKTYTLYIVGPAVTLDSTLSRDL